MKDWTLLKDRKIIDLIIGDTSVSCEMGFQLKMPYMTGGDIVKFAAIFGKELDIEKKLSRWQYMQELIDHISTTNQINKFFKELLNLKRFRTMQYPNRGYYDGQTLYWKTANELLISINQELFYDQCHIEYSFSPYKFILVDDENEIIINTNEIKKIDNEYIKILNEQINKVIAEQDYESAITKSRTLLEEVMIHGIEKKNIEPSDKGDIKILYNQFKDLYKMHANSNLDKRINMLLSGFEKIITAISEMRNNNSDSHGIGNKRIKLENHHVVLFANSSIAMANFLYAVIENNK